MLSSQGQAQEIVFSGSRISSKTPPMIYAQPKTNHFDRSGIHNSAVWGESSSAINLIPVGFFDQHFPYNNKAPGTILHHENETRRSSNSSDEKQKQSKTKK